MLQSAAMAGALALLLCPMSAADGADQHETTPTAADFPIHLASFDWNANYIATTCCGPSPFRYSQASVKVHVDVPPTAQPLVIRNHRLNVIETDAGAVTDRSTYVRFSSLGAHGRRQDSPTRQLSVTFDLPKSLRGVSRLTLLQGEVTVTVAAGTPKRIDLGRIGDIFNRRITVQDIVEGHMSWRYGEYGHMMFECSPALARTLYNVIARNEKGENVTLSTWGDNYNEKLLVVSLSEKLPPETLITLVYYPQAVDVRLPFTFRNVPTPWADPSADANRADAGIVLPIREVSR
jgi:hypothetical protein